MAFLALKKLLAVVVVLAAIGGALGLAVWYPRVDISWSPPIDPTDSTTTLFRITNESLLPIFDVRISCDYRAAISFTTKTIGSNITAESSRVVQRLASGEKTTQSCPNPFGMFTDASMDLEFRVTYRPAPWWPGDPLHHVERFVATNDANGLVRWRELAIAE